MGSEQSTELTKPRVMETANFDFRDKPIRRRSGETTESQNKFLGSTNISEFQRIEKSHQWLEVGMDVVNKMNEINA